MYFETIQLVAGADGLPDGVSLKSVEVQTGIHSAGKDNHVHKDAATVHTIDVKNGSRRTLLFDLKSELPDERVLYGDTGTGDPERTWSQTVKVRGRQDKSGAGWEPAKRTVTHPASCPPGNGHHTDIDIAVKIALDGENVATLGTEEPFTYRFTCTC